VSDAPFLLTLDGISVTRSGRPAPELNNFSLTLSEGETVALLGEEGSGSDAVIRAVAQVSDRDERVIGKIAYRGAKQGTRLRIGYLPSPLSGPLSPARSIASQLSRVLARKFSIPKSAAREELRVALSKFAGAPPIAALSARPSECEPVVLAWALLAATSAQAPELILADDPMRGLSPTTARALTVALLERRRELGAALIYNARALDPAIWASGRVFVMRHGRVVEEGPAEKLASGKTHAYTRTLFRALPRLSTEQPQRKVPRGETLARVQGVALRHEKGASPRAADKVSFELRRGASIALLGEEGAGQHTLVDMMLGLKPISSGRVVMDSVDLGVLSDSMTGRLRRRVAIVTGTDDALDPRMTVRDTIDEPLRAHLQLPRDIVASHRDLAMKRVGLAAQSGGRTVGSLSAFDKRRLQVARAIVSAPMLTIVDEPLRGLDAFAQTIVRDLLADFREQEGSAFLLITSDISIAQALSDEALVFKDGRVVARGPVHELVRDPKDETLRVLIEASLPQKPIETLPTEPREESAGSPLPGAAGTWPSIGDMPLEPSANP
jgi:peptide/nickel transport system ATP-binding protein